MRKIVEAIWYCKYCNTNGISGSKRECPFCGKPRDDNTKFYMPKTITYVDEDTAKKVSRKPDWVCNFCNSLNPDTTDVCTSCGASRTAECLDYFENQMKKTNEGMQPRAAPETVSFCELEEPKNESSSHDTGNGNTHIDNFKNFFVMQ